MSKGDVQFYLDSLVVETVLGNNTTYKTAQSGVQDLLSSLVSSVKEEIGSHIQPDNKVGSVLNLLAPGIISTLFGGKLGMLFGFLWSAFGINATDVLSSVYGFVKGELSQGNKLTPEQINQSVNTAVLEQTPAGEQSEEHQMADTHTASWKDAKFVRLALDDYEKQLFRLTKTSQRRGRSMFDFFGGNTRPRYGQSILGAVLRWIFKVVLMSAGLMVAGDMARKVIHPDESKPSAPSTPSVSQNKFPLNPSYQNAAAPHPWEEQVPNNKSAIESMLVNFTKQVYSGLEGKESAILSSPNFQAVRDQIAWFNHMAEGEPVVYIPSMYANKKAIVDQFIDQVAKSAG